MHVKRISVSETSSIIRCQSTGIDDDDTLSHFIRRQFRFLHYARNELND